MLCPDDKWAGALQIRSSETSPWSRRLPLDSADGDVSELLHVAPCPNAPPNSLAASDLWLQMVTRRVIAVPGNGDDVPDTAFDGMEVDREEEATLVAVEFWPVLRFVSAFHKPRLVFRVVDVRLSYA